MTRTTTSMLAAALLPVLSAAPARAADNPMARAFRAAAAAGWPQEAGAQSADELYREARELVDEGRYDRAVERFTRLASEAPARADAALYWKAYSLAKLGERADALTTLSDLYKRFGESRWLKDGKALEVEIRQASGQAVSPESQSDQELKLLALRGIMQSDPDRGLPLIEQMLSGSDTPVKVKEQALFVLSQSESPKAREAITMIAKGGANPDLQIRAIRYLGVMGGGQNRQVLADVYSSSSDARVKRAIMQSFMIAGDRARLLALSRTEKDPELRGDAVQQLGVMGAHAELSDLYQSESSVEVKKKILQAMFVGGDAARLIELARAEHDPGLRRTAVRDLGLMGADRTGEALQNIYASDPSPDIRRAALQGLFVQNNAHALVALARAEKNPEMKKAIVSTLSLMHSKEATDYLLELLK
ncbi:MAG: HEAT repeat domain-containing protein [Betaproteobacteria bacterium]